MMNFLMTHAADIFGATLVVGPIVLALTLLAVSSRKQRIAPGRSSLKVTRRELETAGQPWLRTYDAHTRGAVGMVGGATGAVGMVGGATGATGFVPRLDNDTRA